jgi:hypothetical protein
MKNFDDFIEEFQPITSPNCDEFYWDGFLFEELPENNKDENFVFTLLDCDEGQMIVSGQHLINAVGYFVTNIPWTDYVEFLGFEYSEIEK